MDHIIHPGGEVILNLRNPNASVAQGTPNAAQNPQEHGNDPSPDSKMSPEDEVLYMFRVQVSAQHLVSASPVFKDLLPADWEERFLQNGPVEITAEGWDLHAFLCFLFAIHNKSYRTPRNLETLAKVAVIAHYYECRGALQNMLGAWLPRLQAMTIRCSRDMILWVWISWFFHLPVHFNHSTSAVMTFYENEIKDLGFPIPPRLIRALNKGRRKAIEFLLTSLSETLEDFEWGDMGCGHECRRIVCQHLTRWMKRYDLDPAPEAPFPNLSYNAIMEHLEAFQIGVCGCDESKFTIFPPYSDLEEDIGGLHLPLYD
ncbi:uncharacterized protein N7503_006340 [Penicillium pulvis]|uniref:uncharacterized protein n=1 Tax=Penicillium pulvis TaxID=1562058 RepID=UPI002549A6A0|nr:uncharacterized protein N7503_006340 [Penicillium pulvis]KAJ5798835.1 hypothetical protein N7503_006340 [Penicillium pulvis]